MSEKLAIFYQELILKGSYHLVLEGIFVTILLSICGLFIGIIIGTLIAILITKKEKNSLQRYITIIVKMYVGFFMGLYCGTTPLYLLCYFTAFRISWK